MIDLYNKNIWNDAKTVNVISEACFSSRPKMVATAIHFFLGTNDSKKDDDDDDEVPDLNSLKYRMKITKKKGSKSTLLEKAKMSIRKV
jgi:protein SDA1